MCVVSTERVHIMNSMNSMFLVCGVFQLTDILSCTQAKQKLLRMYKWYTLSILDI